MLIFGVNMGQTQTVIMVFGIDFTWTIVEEF